MQIPKHKAKIVIIEGPDCAGKSTFIDVIKKRWIRHWGEDAHIINAHQGPPISTNADEIYKLPLVEFVVDHGYKKSTLFIADRWHVGEVVYGPILRGKSIYTQDWLNNFEQELKEADAKKIMLLPPINVIIERFKTRGDNLVDETQLRRIHQAYLNFYSTNYYNWAMCVNTDPDRWEWLADLYIGL